MAWELQSGLLLQPQSSLAPQLHKQLLQRLQLQQMEQPVVLLELQMDHFDL